MYFIHLEQHICYWSSVFVSSFILPGKLNGIDLPQEVKGETEGCLQTAHSLISTEFEQQDVSELKANEVFMNGSDLKSDDGSLLFTELKDSRWVCVGGCFIVKAVICHTRNPSVFKFSLLLYVALDQILHPTSFLVFLWLALGTWYVHAVSLQVHAESVSSEQLFV